MSEALKLKYICPDAGKCDKKNGRTCFHGTAHEHDSTCVKDKTCKKCVIKAL